MDSVLNEKVSKEEVLELIFESKKKYDNHEQDEVFDVYGDYLFPTETVLEKPNIISGAYVF